MRLLADGDAKGIIEAIREIDEQFPDYARLLDDVARDLQRVAVFQVVGSSDGEDDLSEAEIAELANAMPIADVQLFYQIAIMGRRDLHLAPDPRGGAEMTLLRMLAFKPAATETTASAGGGPAASRETSAGTMAPKMVAAKLARSDTENSKPEPAAQSQTQTQTQTHAWTEPDWRELVTTLGFSGAVRLLAGNCAYLRREGNVVYLGLDPRSESMFTKQRMDVIAECLSKHFGEKLVVDIVIGSQSEETPSQQVTRVADERLEEARRSLEADPNVQAMKNMFGAELKTDTIEIISGDKQ